MTAPLWVFLRGGGVGCFDAAGTPQPDASQMTEESPESQREDLANPGLMAPRAGDRRPGAREPVGHLRLCVDDVRKPGDCDRHVVTTAAGLRNTDPSSPPDHLATIMRWVRARLADR